MKRCLLFMLFFIYLLSTTVLHAATVANAPPVPVDDNVHINADYMSQETATESYIATGNVVVDWQGMKLTADRVRYLAPEKMLYASGNVVMTKGNSVLKGQEFVYNMETERAEIDPGLLTIPESSMTINSEKLIRISENEFAGTTTELTSCDIADPSWKFVTQSMNVDTQGYATGRHVIFYVKSVPVLYLPWLAIPVSHERRSGVLFPRFSQSTQRGLQLEVPIYWVISPNQDLQFDIDLMEKRGAGTGLNYRYIRKRGSEGHIYGFQVYDKMTQSLRWQVVQDHKEIFSPNANLRMTVNRSGDHSFLADFGVSTGEYNRQSSESVINTLNTWPNYAVTTNIRYNENLYVSGNQATIQTLPSVGLSGVRQTLLKERIYFDLDSFAENLYREAGTSGQRLLLYPRITLLPFNSNIVQSSFYSGAHIRGYRTDKQDAGTSIQTTSGSIVPEAGARFSTSLLRSFDTGSQSLTRIRHEIVPEISYAYIPQQDQQALPVYDLSDRVKQRSMMTFSTTNLISGNFNSAGINEGRELARIKFEARYAFAGEQQDLLTLVNNDRKWSDLIMDSETYLSRQLKLILDARYSMYGDHITSTAAGVEFDDRNGNSARGSYVMSRNDVEYFEARLSSKLLKPFTLSYSTRYSFDRGDFLESVYSAEYRHKCWSLQLAMHQRPDSQSYSFNFTLAGLGGK